MPEGIDINGYNVDDEDYWLIDEVTQSGVIEIKGRRTEQEDRCALTILEGFETLPDSRQSGVLDNAVAAMQEQFGSKEIAKRSGSTLCASAAWVDGNNYLQAKSIHLGDSLAYIVVVDMKNKFIKTIKLNKNTHNIKDNAAELTRIEQSGRQIYSSKEYGMGIRVGNDLLTVSRAIGDPDILTHEADHVPDIDVLMNHDNSRGVLLQPHQLAFMIVACDGLTETVYNMTEERLEPALSDDDVGDCVARNYASPQRAAHALAKLAYDKGSCDNISVIVSPITPNHPPVMASVYDGHNGVRVAQRLYENFSNELMKNLQKALENQHEKNTKRLTSAVTKTKFLDGLTLYLNDPLTRRDSILRLFSELKCKGGMYSVIHQSDSPKFDQVRLFFKRKCNKESNFWHTPEYQKAVKLLKEAYFTKESLPFNSEYQNEEAEFIDYIRGNASYHSSNTATRIKFGGR